MRVFSLFVSFRNTKNNKEQAKSSAAASPNKTAAQAAERPFTIYFLTSIKISKILIPCSKIWESALGVTRLTAMKYPRKQEEIPINGKEKGRILRADKALMSPIKVSAINSAAKNTVTREIAAKIEIIPTQR